MACDMTEEDFDQAAKRIVDQEFAEVVGWGLLTTDVLAPIAVRMVETIHREFPVMTSREVEYHLRLLREECRKTADRITKMAKDTGWLTWKKDMEGKEEPKPIEDGNVLF